MVLRLNAVAVSRLNVETIQRRNVAVVRRLNGKLVHQRIADGVRVRSRARQRLANSRVTIAVWQHHRRNVQRDPHSSGHKRNAYRDQYDLRLASSVRRPLRRGELNVRLHELNVHNHNRGQSVHAHNRAVLRPRQRNRA